MNLHEFSSNSEHDTGSQRVALLRGREEVQLDGTFTAADLRKIARWIEAIHVSQRVSTNAGGNEDKYPGPVE